MYDPYRNFQGAKVMLFAGPELIALERDDAPGVIWPGCLDFPGGGREGQECPEECVAREVHEELGLNIGPADLQLAALRDTGQSANWFFAAHLPKSIVQQVRFGGEGRGWLTMPPEDFAGSEKAIPHFREILRRYM